jgi:hypothetical protein
MTVLFAYIADVIDQHRPPVSEVVGDAGEPQRARGHPL